MICQCVRCPSWFCIEPMQKSPCRNALWRENRLSCVPAFPHPTSKLGLRPTEEREGKNCLGKIKRKRKEGRKERREGGRDGKVLIEALTLYRANPIPETKCTRTSMPRWLLISEHSLWPQTFSLLEKTQEGCSLHGIRGQRLTESGWFHFSKPQLLRIDFKNIPLQSSKESRPELGSGWYNRTASAGHQDPSCPEHRSWVSYGLFSNSTSN